MKAREYYAAVQAAILEAPQVIHSDITFDEVTGSECYIRGVLTMDVKPSPAMDLESALAASIDFIK